MLTQAAFSPATYRYRVSWKRRKEEEPHFLNSSYPTRAAAEAHIASLQRFWGNLKFTIHEKEDTCLPKQT